MSGNGLQHYEHFPQRRQNMPNAKKIILPYELNVESIAYQTQAFPLGIVKANVADYDCWLCNKCINFFLPSYSKLFSVYEEDLWSCQDGLMTFCEKKFTPETFQSECSKIVEENKSMLDNGYYIFGVYNEFYIPQKKVYHKRDFMHGYIIFVMMRRRCLSQLATWQMGIIDSLILSMRIIIIV